MCSLGWKHPRHPTSLHHPRSYLHTVLCHLSHTYSSLLAREVLSLKARPSDVSQSIKGVYSALLLLHTCSKSGEPCPQPAVHTCCIQAESGADHPFQQHHDQCPKPFSRSRSYLPLRNVSRQKSLTFFCLSIRFGVVEEGAQGPDQYTLHWQSRTA